MYFKKLEIIGFKSFAEKVSLRFEPGLTAVVGPNGCGKSNIFDSIRWALGEQSIKALRGSKMEDIIFNGTEKIPALGFAEVSITLSNETKILPIDYEEVTITRRLYRSGESEYLINNNAVRLKDINELLMGTGIGAESYSLVEQGKIDLVLSSRPEDRRLVFDEATGVSKYKAKKKEALRKLEDTENNLLRVNDIIQEVKRQIASIERQANRARRYREVFDKLKEQEINFANYQIGKLAEECRSLKEIEAEIRQKVGGNDTTIEKLGKQLELIQKGIENLNHETLRLNNELINSSNSADRKIQLTKINEERVVELASRIKTIETQKINLAKRIEQREAELAKVTLDFEKNKQYSQEKQKLLLQGESGLKESQELIQQAQEKIKQANSKNFDIASNKTKLNNESIDISSSLNSQNARKQRLETELLKTKEENESGQKELNSIKEQVESLRDDFKKKENEANSLKDVLAKANLKIEKTNEEKDKLNEMRISLESQKEFLQQLKLKYEDMASAKEAELIIKNIDEIDEKNITGIIAKSKSVSYDKENKIYRIQCEAKMFSLDIELLEEKIAQLQKKIQEKTSHIEEQKLQIQQWKQQLEALEAEMQRQQINLADKEAVLKNHQANFQKICDELSLLDIDLEDITTNINKLTQRKIEVQKEIERLNQENDSQESIIVSYQSQLQENNKKRESLLVQITELKTELNSIKEKEADVEATKSMLERTLLDDRKTFDTQKNEKKECEIKTSELNQESIRFKEEIEKLKETSVQLDKQLKTKKQELARKENELEQIKEEIQNQISQNTQNKDKLHKQELNIQENIFKLNQIKERMSQVYQHEIIEETAHSSIPIDIDLAATKQDIEHLRKKVDNFGTVNLVAIKELEELRSRCDFLEKQQSDLNAAKNSLSQAIQKINRTTRKMFLDTFNMVAKEFKDYFRLLFGGGDAELFLIDEENVLESGIEIVCRPPGKKLQNILLLSGGEKSLAAIALIFAIFKTKPAPFCVLDEIDAALDESNVDRFSRLLKEFVSISQFIVITHNKKTIAHANVMYGITMEQSGISKIVSVKLKENDEPASKKEQRTANNKKSAVSTAEPN